MRRLFTFSKNAVPPEHPAAEPTAPGPRARENRIEVLDGLRAFAALSVCLFHFICTTRGYVESQWVLNSAWVGQYGVHLFFVISGFVIPWAMYTAGYRLNNFFPFLLKRVSRLEPPYLFSLALALLVLHLRGKFMGAGSGDPPPSGRQVLLHIGYLIPFSKGYQWVNPVYWTLAVEFQYYLLIALLYVPLIRSKQAVRVVLYLALIGASFLAGRSFLVYWLPVFLLGILVFLYKSGTIAPPEYCLASAATTAFCVYRYPTAAVVYAMIPVVALLFWQNVRIRGLHSLGRYSYSIYLIHAVLGTSLINVLSHHYRGPVAKVAVISAGMALTLAASWLTNVLVEEPSRRLSASIRYRNGVPAGTGLVPSGARLGEVLHRDRELGAGGQVGAGQQV
jgi:peptidoglycan/LPS O-acetylase OafA/YrhL